MIRSQQLKPKTEERRAYWLFVLPAFIVYISVLAFPTIFSVLLSLTNYNGGKLFNNPIRATKFVGLKWYKVLFSDPLFYISLKNNMAIVLISVFGQIPLGFLLAYILFRGIIRCKDFFQTIVYLPSIISPVIIGILWKAFFSPSGAMPEIIKIINPAYEMEVSRYPMLNVLFVILWMYTGGYLIIFAANLQKINTSVIEASIIDGCTELQSLRHIILPSLSGVIVTSCILAISGSLKSFDLVYSLTGGGPGNSTSVLSLYMYNKAFAGIPKYPLANAISTVMVLISFVLIYITKLLERIYGGRE
ncbi:MAG: sugar ABC transporter permease [Treponema sp.]